MSRMPTQRVEVFSIWFTNKSLSNNNNQNSDNNNNQNSDNNNKNGDTKNNDTDTDTDPDADVVMYEEYVDELKDTYRIDKDPGYFKGRIFIADQFLLHEIYNSAMEDHIYTEVLTKKSFKRKRLNCISVYTDLPGTKSKDSTSGLADLLPGSPSEEDFQESAGTSQIFKSVSDQRTDLSLMGPNTGMITFDSFRVIVHPDSGNADKEKSYVDHANSRYFWRRGIPTDYYGFRTLTLNSCDKPFLFTVDCGSRSLNLDCIAFSDAKAVHLVVKWPKQEDYAVTDDVYICGRLTVVSNDFQEKESVLFDSPLNKAILVKHGKSIPLLKSVVALPYDSSFQVHANLHCFDNASSALIAIVNGSATFPYVDDDDDLNEASFSPTFTDGRVEFPSVFYESKKCIAGIDGGQLEVTAFVDFQ